MLLWPQPLQSVEAEPWNATTGCFGGEQQHHPKSGCLGKLTSQKKQWTARNRSFLDHANDDWYQVIKQMRALSARYGKDPD